MTEEKRNILTNIAAGFLTNSAIDTGLYVAMNAPKYKFHLGNENFQKNFKVNFQNILRDNAVSNVTYYTSIALLQRFLNKEDEFEKRLYIRIGGSVLSTLAVEAGFYREKKFRILGSVALSASTEFAFTLYKDWQKGGKQYAQTHFPAIYKSVSNSKFAQIYQAQIQQNQQHPNQDQ